jgi:hypothetical protein
MRNTEAKPHTSQQYEILGDASHRVLLICDIISDIWILPRKSERVDLCNGYEQNPCLYKCLGRNLCIWVIKSREI